MSLEHLFATSVLSLSIPDTSISLPPTDPADEWLQALASSTHERKQAFFDEQLHSLLTLRVEHPTSDEQPDSSHPPAALLAFLAHVQISLEASYISSAPAPIDSPQTSRLSAPPRTASLALKPSGRGGSHHPSILPPNTPNPTPATADQDKKYVSAQGTILLTSIWGQNPSDDSPEEFALVWSEEEKLWVAVYRLALTVSFLRLNFADPLLCLTISVTLREKPVAKASSQHPFIRFLRSFGEISSTIVPESPTVTDTTQVQQDIDQLVGFEEVNLLEGLLAGPTFSKMGPSELNLPSTRLGVVSRQKLFALPPVNIPTPNAPSPSPLSAARKAHPTLRKSYRKTLETVSGFRVRMRTVFVPSVVLHATQEHDRMTAGNEERTVVLCVEIENFAEFGRATGFEVEKVDVSISGDEAKATLITWGNEFLTTDTATFPLKIAQGAQYNLLYAVTFLRSPEELDAFSFTRTSGNNPQTDLQRAVSINIHGRPYQHSQEVTLYPTQMFSSRWNCILDLAAHQSQALRNLDTSDPSNAHPSVLPEPPSPFPVFGLQPSKLSPITGTTAAAEGVKSQLLAGRVIKSPTPRRASVPMNANPARLSYLQSAQSQLPRSPTTYSAPPLPPEHDRPYPGLSPSAQTPGFDIPATPAYPAFPPKSMPSPAPVSQGPIASQSSVGVVGPSVEVKRGRTPISGGLDPVTPMQYHPSGGSFEAAQKAWMGVPPGGDSGDKIVISVGLLPDIRSGGVCSRLRDAQHVPELGPERIYPLDTFTLDIFVFNRSERTRRFEINCLEQRRRRREGENTGNLDSVSGARKMGYPGILPMEGRVRIGPLLPSTCQSVRMEFLAVSPGVHTIEALTLTDIESGFSINLRSVMDIVVHKPDKWSDGNSNYLTP